MDIPQHFSFSFPSYGHDGFTDDLAKYDSDGDTDRYLNFLEPPLLDPLSYQPAPPLPFPVESIPPSPSPVSYNNIGLTTNQVAAPGNVLSNLIMGSAVGSSSRSSSESYLSPGPDFGN